MTPEEADTITGAHRDPPEDLGLYLPRQPRMPHTPQPAQGQMFLFPPDSEVSDRRNGPGGDRHAINPLEILSDTLNATVGMMKNGHAAEARLWLRQQLEGMLRYMCPICGRTDTHESDWPQLHRFVAPHQKELA